MSERVGASRTAGFGADHSFYRWIVLGAVVVMVVRIALTYRVFNDVIDEPYHLGAGVAMYEAKRHVYGVQHPPLPRLVGALPLVLAGARGSARDLVTRDTIDDLPAFTVGHRALLSGPLPYWDALTRARAAVLVFPVLAVVYVYLLGRYVSNRLTGCVAAVFFSTDPTLLAHGGLVTTDVAACVGYLAATYHGLRFVARPNWRRMTAAGAATGLALACKFSCALVLPALGLLWLLRGRRARATAPRAVPLGAGALVVAAFTLWATYGFDVGRVDALNVVDVRVLDRLPQWIRNATLPMPTAFVGYYTLAQHNQAGHPAYLNGRVSAGGWWYYFPEAVALKSPVALLVGLAVAVVFLALARRRRPLRTAALLVPFGVFMLAAMTSGINIGVRHVLPALPFLYLFVAMWLARGRRVALAAALIVVAFVETAALHPDYVAFFNVLAGGPRGGERYLLDSNLDWGQDMARLHAWLEMNARGRVVTTRLFGNPRLYQWPREHFTLAPGNAPPHGLFAISRNYAHDVYPNPGSRWVLKLEPVARIGYSIDVYDLDAPSRRAR